MYWRSWRNQEARAGAGNLGLGKVRWLDGYLDICLKVILCSLTGGDEREARGGGKQVLWLNGPVDEICGILCRSELKQDMIYRTGRAGELRNPGVEDVSETDQRNRWSRRESRPQGSGGTSVSAATVLLLSQQLISSHELHLQLPAATPLQERLGETPTQNISSHRILTEDPLINICSRLYFNTVALIIYCHPYHKKSLFHF